MLGAVYGTRAIMCVFGVFKNRAVGRGVYSFLRCEPFSLQRCVCVCVSGEGKGRHWPCGLECPCVPVQVQGYLCRGGISLCRPVREGLNTSLTLTECVCM